MLNLRKTLLVLLLLSSLVTGCALTSPPSLTDSGEGIIKASSSPLMWQKIRSPLFTSWEDADNYVKNLKLGGYSDWRLPTSEEFLELYFVFDFGNAKAKDYGIIIEGNYWSAGKDGPVFCGAWKDGDSCEISRNYQPATKGYVRAVRP
ncbi:MAG: DUF1566 domain-containing protein [Thermodesulfobacteriota bacterium]